jgi:hypothetical protein
MWLRIGPAGFCEHESAPSNAEKPGSILTIKCSRKTHYQIQVVWDLGAYIFRVHLLIEDWRILRYDVMYLGRTCCLQLQGEDIDNSFL